MTRYIIILLLGWNAINICESTCGKNLKDSFGVVIHNINFRDRQNCSWTFKPPANGPNLLIINMFQVYLLNKDFEYIFFPDGSMPIEHDISPVTDGICRKFLISDDEYSNCSNAFGNQYCKQREIIKPLNGTPTLRVESNSSSFILNISFAYTFVECPSKVINVHPTIKPGLSETTFADNNPTKISASFVQTQEPLTKANRMKEDLCKQDSISQMLLIIVIVLAATFVVSFIVIVIFIIKMKRNFPTSINDEVDHQTNSANISQQRAIKPMVDNMLYEEYPISQMATLSNKEKPKVVTQEVNSLTNNVRTCELVDNILYHTFEGNAEQKITDLQM